MSLPAPLLARDPKGGLPPFSLQVIVQHHPARVELLPRLLDRLDDPLVVSDPDPAGISSPWRCQRLCLRAGGDASHLLVIQDDAVPCDFFTETVLAAIEAKPLAALAFFVSPQARVTCSAMTVAMKKRQPWARWSQRDHWPLVASSYPRALAERIAEHVDRTKPDTRGDDAPVAEALRVLRAEAWATVPSLAQHPDDVTSLIGRKFLNGANKARCAKYFVSEKDPRTICW